jgi:D-alanine-D-alanine ligase
MNVVLLFDDVETRSDATPDEMGVLESVDMIAAVLEQAGHEPRRVGVSAGTAWIRCLDGIRPDVVFNLCEGVDGSSARESGVAAVVELLGIPMTGSGSETLSLARRKDRVNAVLGAAGLAVPAWRCAAANVGAGQDMGVTHDLHGGHQTAHESCADWSHFPAIVKPAGEDGSVGIRQSSVVRDVDALSTVVAELDDPCAWLVQAFVPGREFNVAFVGPDVLPLAEIDYSAMPSASWPIVSYDAKWDAGSAEDRGTRPVCPALIDEALAKRIVDAGRHAWSAVGGTGYGRVDVRLDETETRAWVLDVNPNPDLAPGAGLARAAGRHGWSYSDLVLRIVDLAVTP